MPTDSAVVARWLTGIGMLVIGQLSEDEANAKIRAYVALLAPDYPPSSFGAASLKAFAARCKFFPSYSEVVEHLEGWTAPRRDSKPVAEWTDQDWLDQALSATGKPSLVRVFLQHQPGALALFEASVKAIEGPPCNPEYAEAAVNRALLAIAHTTRKSA